MYLARDFIQTSEGLVFAIVEKGTEQGKILCFLRYILIESQWVKVNTVQANKFLTENHPHYLYFSLSKQAYLHAVAEDKVVFHYLPRARLKCILTNKTSRDQVENDLLELFSLFIKCGLNIDMMGVTGSILIAAHNDNSDIDLVCYCRTTFDQTRQVVQKLIMSGDCGELTEQDWQEAYDRRCCDLSYSEYVWHEKRKFNKGMINQRKFDLSFVSDQNQPLQDVQFEKIKHIILKVRVIDDSHAFDYPAEFGIHHDQIKTIVCYTATYTGQAMIGEWVEVSGVLEQTSDGIKRIIVGSSREASGEYIKVLHAESE